MNFVEEQEKKEKKSGVSSQQHQTLYISYKIERNGVGCPTKSILSPSPSTPQSMRPVGGGQSIYSPPGPFRATCPQHGPMMLIRTGAPSPQCWPGDWFKRRNLLYNTGPELSRLLKWMTKGYIFNFYSQKITTNTNQHIHIHCRRMHTVMSASPYKHV